MPTTVLMRGPVSLRTCYAVSATEILCLALSLRASYVMSGTDVVYLPIILRAYYALSGTDVAYGRSWTSGHMEVRKGTVGSGLRNAHVHSTEEPGKPTSPYDMLCEVRYWQSVGV
eukprot:2573899-Rhodomonas_salina.1